MGEFEKVESEYLNAEQIKGKPDVVLKIVDTIEKQKTDFGPKPTGTVEYRDGLATIKKSMRFNQTMINWLIEKTKSNKSEKWVGIEIPVTVEKIKGNDAIVPKK